MIQATGFKEEVLMNAGTAAFLSMPNEFGIVTGGKSLPLSTRQVSDVVQLDEDILRPKGGRHVPDDSHEIQDLEKRREAVRKVCALRYLEGYPDTKVIDSIKENL